MPNKRCRAESQMLLDCGHRIQVNEEFIDSGYTVWCIPCDEVEPEQFARRVPDGSTRALEITGATVHFDQPGCVRLQDTGSESLEGMVMPIGSDRGGLSDGDRVVITLTPTTVDDNGFQGVSIDIEPV